HDAPRRHQPRVRRGPARRQAPRRPLVLPRRDRQRPRRRVLIDRLIRDRRDRRRRVGRPPAPHRGVHVGLDLGRRQRPVVDPHLVQPPREVLPPLVVVPPPQHPPPRRGPPPPP